MLFVFSNVKMKCYIFCLPKEDCFQSLCILIGWMSRAKQMDETCYTNFEWLARLLSFFGREFHLSTLLNGLEGWVVVTSLLRGPW